MQNLECQRTGPLFETQEADGDRLIVEEVFGFAEPMLALFLEQDHGDLCGLNLTMTQATALEAALHRWVDRVLTCMPAKPVPETRVEAARRALIDDALARLPGKPLAPDDLAR